LINASTVIVILAIFLGLIALAIVVGDFIDDGALTNTNVYLVIGLVVVAVIILIAGTLLVKHT
jgi:hypothetical protein